MVGNTLQKTKNVVVGILALQGDFAKHAEAITRLGASVTYIRHAKQMADIDALILPGGESSALLRLLSDDLKNQIKQRISCGLPTLATCAGAILLANQVENPSQESLDAIDISIKRNGYGRQINSFISKEIRLTDKARELFSETLDFQPTFLEGIFIRAPRISSFGNSVEVLATCDKEPVLVRKDNLLVATFHPELGNSNSSIHQVLLSFAK